MSKAFISKVLQQSTEVTGAAANRATNDLIDAIVKEMKKAISDKDFEKAVFLREREIELKEEIEDLRAAARGR